MPLTCEKRYLLIVEDFLEQLSDSLDEILDSDPTFIDDINFSSGVLKIECQGGKTYVLNKQAPNKQLWLSSPFSGPQRYEYDMTTK